MTLSERKIKLASFILNQADEGMIKSLENLYDYTQDNAYAMSPEDIKELQESVRRGVQDMEAGRVTPHEEVMKRYHL